MQFYNPYLLRRLCTAWNVSCLVCLEAKKYLGTLSFLYHKQVWFFYSCQQKQHRFSFIGAYRTEKMQLAHMFCWHCAHCACPVMRRNNSAMRWTVMIHENRKLKSLESKVILLVTFSPRHLALMSVESLKLRMKHSYMKVNHEETGSFLCLLFCQIYVKFSLGLELWVHLKSEI